MELGVNSNLSSRQERVVWLDSCKGFAMILVVIGHVMNGYRGARMFADCDFLMTVISNGIYSFHMALYFSVSGIVFYLAYGSQKTEQRRKYRTQVINLVIVYFLFSILQWGFKMVLTSGINDVFTIKDLILMPIRPMSPYWYLWNLIFYYLVFYWLAGKKWKDKTLAVITLIISIIGSFIPAWTHNSRTLPFYIFSFGVGIFLAKTEYKVLCNPRLITVNIAVCFGGVYLVTVQNIDVQKIPIFSLIVAMGTTCLVLSFFAVVVQKHKVKILELIGKYSLEIYTTHCFITAGNRRLLFRIGIHNFLLNVFVNTIMAIAIPVFGAWILKKINLHKLIFRPSTWWNEQKVRKMGKSRGDMKCKKYNNHSGR